MSLPSPLPTAVAVWRSQNEVSDSFGSLEFPLFLSEMCVFRFDLGMILRDSIQLPPTKSPSPSVCFSSIL